MRSVLQILAIFVPLSCQAISSEQIFQSKRAVRQIDAQRVKAYVMEYCADKVQPGVSSNGDESLYSDLRGTFGKSLNHQANGYIDVTSFNSLKYALLDGSPTTFDQIQIGTGTLKLANPQGSLCYSLAGNDGWFHTMPAAPAFASAETAGEMVELYWTVLCRDVPFNEFDSNAIVADAVADLNTLSNFKGPKVGGVVTTGTFLRGNTSGDLVGPYVSQFLYQNIPFGSTTIPPEQTVPTPGTTNDFLTTFADWYTVVNGGATGDSITYEGTQRFISTPRDLGEYVHSDFPGQPFLSALLIINSYGSDAVDPANPYLNNANQGGFVSFGIGQYVELLNEAVEEGLKAAWFHKWQVNRRLRPEEFGFYVQRQIVEGDSLGINAELIDSNALTQIFSNFSSYFLPQAYPEGCPTHPSYPAGHAVISGACATLLKALFNEDFEIPSPLQPNATNTALEAYGGTLRLGDELNKLAANISLGRDHAGVHYRSDGIEGILLGEKIAIDILNNCAFLNNENFEGYTLTKFDGTTIKVGTAQ